MIFVLLYDYGEFLVFTVFCCDVVVNSWRSPSYNIETVWWSLVEVCPIGIRVQGESLVIWTLFLGEKVSHPGRTDYFWVSTNDRCIK
jgi:hypothetical protein